MVLIQIQQSLVNQKNRLCGPLSGQKSPYEIINKRFKNPSLQLYPVDLFGFIHYQNFNLSIALNIDVCITYFFIETLIFFLLSF